MIRTRSASVRAARSLSTTFTSAKRSFHFDHEQIPERVVHARGYGAHGFFETYQSLAAYTKADLFQRPGEKTPAFVRFSTVAGNKGSADLARDVRGFAVKLYTQEETGIWSATTFRCFSSRMRSNSLTWSMLLSRNPTGRSHKRRRPMIISGILSA